MTDGETGKVFTEEDIETHHIVLVKDGGSDKAENLYQLQSACHKQEHIRSQFRGAINYDKVGQAFSRGWKYGLSGMIGNCHVPFFGEVREATFKPYPISMFRVL
ncbi:hypothetical protein H1P_3170006 [Hyella patelloides LEGE 07179]|uniref:HNH domain-containing protein n=1 Tax=Hyella patelloides LEGE 07179 TaxID=945734 RepID=A0A563VUY2_9CYAN|nr:HNH endonuclease signature motif containing protein [Hyella patelloides]VEP15218.1 hypothetical protein H1P_3170006 [Hyella patelloides LEGE 07179]